MVVVLLLFEDNGGWRSREKVGGDVLMHGHEMSSIYCITLPCGLAAIGLGPILHREEGGQLRFSPLSFSTP